MGTAPEAPCAFHSCHSHLQPRMSQASPSDLAPPTMLRRQGGPFKLSACFELGEAHLDSLQVEPNTGKRMGCSPPNKSSVTDPHCP